MPIPWRLVRLGAMDPITKLITVKLVSTVGKDGIGIGWVLCSKEKMRMIDLVIR